MIVEPQMMELRFGDEPLRPRFDLELSPDGGTQVRVLSSFQRSGDPRKFTTAHGAWFEGSPGWYLDPQEGVARPLDRRVSSAAIHRLTRAPFIHEAIERLPALIAQGLPQASPSRSAPSFRTCPRSPTWSISSPPSACARAARW